MTVEFLHELYEEELLYKESISMSYSMLQSLGQNEDVPIVGASICWSPNEIVGPEWEEQYVVMDQLMAQDGIEAVYSYQIYDNMTYSKHRAHISANCKDPKAAIRFLNLFYREDYSVQSYYGSFGVGVQADEKLHYEVLVPEESSDEGWQRRYSMVDNGIYYFAEELENRIDPPESILKLLEDETGKKTVAPEDGEAVERIHLKNSEIIEADRIQRSLENLSLKALAEFLSEGISDEAWERFQQKLKAAEVDSLVDIYETAQNREYG